MNAGIIILAVIAVLVLLLILWLFSTYNNFVRRRSDCEEGFSSMDVSLKKRYDLIPNLVETVKGYAKHEGETLEKVVAARSKAANAATAEERFNDEKELSGALRQLLAITEAYPDLKANTNFMDLQGQLQKIEGEIANSRKFYNAVVKSYNNLCYMVPSNIVAALFRFQPKPMYEVDDEGERRNVKVQF